MHRPDAARATPPVLPVSVVVSQARLLDRAQRGVAAGSAARSGHSRAASGHCYFEPQGRAPRSGASCSGSRRSTSTSRCATALASKCAPRRRSTRRAVNSSSTCASGWPGSVRCTSDCARLKAKPGPPAGSPPGAASERCRRIRAVAMVTSPRAAALRDVLSGHAGAALARGAHRRLSRVGAGTEAAAEIAQAIRVANARAEVDVLIVTVARQSRGPGAFNEAPVARTRGVRLDATHRVGRGPRDGLHDLRLHRRRPRPHAHRRRFAGGGRPRRRWRHRRRKAHSRVVPGQRAIRMVIAPSDSMPRAVPRPDRPAGPARGELAPAARCARVGLERASQRLARYPVDACASCARRCPPRSKLSRLADAWQRLGARGLRARPSACRRTRPEPLAVSIRRQC